jgi:hypothetical protein
MGCLGNSRPMRPTLFQKINEPGLRGNPQLPVS